MTDTNIARQVLNLPMKGNEAGAETVRDYLKELLLTLWDEGEGFSGKRPFGNSGWEHDLFIPLLKAGLIEGRLDEDGYVDEVNTGQGQELIKQAITALT